MNLDDGSTKFGLPIALATDPFRVAAQDRLHRSGENHWRRSRKSGTSPSACYRRPSPPRTRFRRRVPRASDFQAAAVTASSRGPIPPNLLFTLNTSLMGQPGSTGSDIASVGPSVDGASVALADSASGLIPGIRYVSMFQTGSSGDIGLLADVNQAASKDRPGGQASAAAPHTPPIGSTRMPRASWPTKMRCSARVVAPRGRHDPRLVCPTSSDSLNSR